MNSKSLRLALFSLFAALVIGSGFYVFSLVTSDNLKFQKGDFAHTLIVRSDTIRNFPIINPFDDDIYFTYSARDGTAPEQITMSYDSLASVDELPEKFAAFCKEQNYAAVPQSDYLLRSILACDAPDYRIEIELYLPRHNATRVTVSFLGRSV